MELCSNPSIVIHPWGWHEGVWPPPHVDLKAHCCRWICFHRCCILEVMFEFESNIVNNLKIINLECISSLMTTFSIHSYPDFTLVSVAIIEDLVFDSLYIHVGAWSIVMLFPHDLTSGKPRALLPTLNIVVKYFSSLRGTHVQSSCFFPNRLPLYLWALSMY